MDIDRWQRTAAGNNALAPNGFPEGMTRQDVNDSSRELMAGTKRFYDAPDFRNPFFNFALVRTTGTIWILVDGGGQTNAGQFLEVGQRVKMVETSNPSVNFWEGWVAAVAAYGAPNQNVTFQWLAAFSKDEIGPTSNVNILLTVGPKELGTAAWMDVGSDPGEIPRVEDIQDYAITTPEDELDVGSVQGLTASEIAEASVRGRLNPNGGFVFWQRGVNFTSATTPNNNANQSIADNWTLLSDGNDRVLVTRDGDVPAGVPVRYSLKATVSIGAGANQKHGFITFAELDDALDVGSSSSTRRVSLSFWIKQGSIAGVKSVRAYLLNIKTPYPSITPVSAWASGSEGVDVGWDNAQWEQVGVSVDVDLDAIGVNWTEFKLENVLMAAAGVGAIAIAFVVDDAVIATPASWHLTAVQVNRGAIALPFLPAPVAVERLRCDRYFESTFDYEAGIYPSAAQGAAHAIAVRNVSGGQVMALPWRFRVPKFKVPTIGTYNPRVAGTGFDDTTASTVAFASSTQNRDGATILSANTASANTTYYLGLHAAAQIWGTG